MKKIAFLAILFMLLCGCDAWSEKTVSTSTVKEVISQTAEVQQGDFIFRLVSERPSYGEFEVPAIYGELLYIGEEDSIDISHSASPFYFPITEKTRGYEIDYAMDDPLLVTTLKKGEPYRETYRFAGGFSDRDSAEYAAFVQSIVDHGGGLPQGEYVMNGRARFLAGVAPGDMAVEYDMQSTIGFQVK